jgi:hypothetical protein
MAHVESGNKEQVSLWMREQFTFSLDPFEKT